MHIKSQIEKGLYASGEKIPSVRSLSRSLKASVYTVQQAYHLLEDERVLEVKDRSGYYVASLKKSVASSEILEVPKTNLSPIDVNINQFATGFFQKLDDKSILNLATSYPKSDFLPVGQLKKISQNLVREKMSYFLEGKFSLGEPLLKKSIARRLGERGTIVDKSQVIITNGCQEAISLCLRAIANPGDTIAIESPAFVGLLRSIEALGMKALEIPAHPISGLSIDFFEEAISKWPIKALAVTPSFNNPLGSNMPTTNRKKLAEICNKNQIPIIEDDSLGDLYFGKNPSKTLKSFDTNGNILYCSSVSKSIAPGLRVGWIIPGRYFSKISFLKSFTHVSVAPLIQNILGEFLASGASQRHFRQLRQNLKNQKELFLFSIFNNFPNGTLVSNPDGGLALWIRLPNKFSAVEFSDLALKKNIAVVPGNLFSSSDSYNDYIRINIGIKWSDRINQAIKQLGKIIP